MLCQKQKTSLPLTWTNKIVEAVNWSVTQLVEWVADLFGIDDPNAIIQPAVATPRGEDLSPYELAYLAGGWQRVLQATAAELVRYGALQIKNPTWTETRVHAVEKRSAGILPIERYVYAQVASNGNGIGVRGLIFGGESESGGVDDLQHSLQDRGFLENRHDFARRQMSRLRDIVFSHLIVCVLVPFVLAAALWVAFQFDPSFIEPQGLRLALGFAAPFTLLCIPIFPAMFEIFQLRRAKPNLTPYTERFLVAARKRTARLRDRVRSNDHVCFSGSLLRGEVALVVALFGIDHCTSQYDSLRAIGEENLRRLAEEDNCA